MTAIYLVAAVVGLPLVVYSILGGDGDAGDVGDIGDVGEVGDGGIIAYLSLGMLAFFAGFFGLAGLATTLAGASSLAAFVSALVAGLAAGGAHRGLLGYVKGSSASSHVSDAELAGRVAKVVVPLRPGHRGRITLDVAGQHTYLTAELVGRATAALDAGSAVVIVEIEGGVARVTDLDPELA